MCNKRYIKGNAKSLTSILKSRPERCCHIYGTLWNINDHKVNKLTAWYLLQSEINTADAESKAFGACTAVIAKFHMSSITFK